MEHMGSFLPSSNITQGTMIRKRNRSIHKNQIGDGCFSLDPQVQKHRTNPTFSIPSLFVVGLDSRAQFEHDAARSPTYPLDFRVLSNINCHLMPPERNSVKVGLGIIDYLDEQNNGKIPTDNVVFGPKTKIKASDIGNHVDFSLPNSVAENFLSLLDTGRISSTSQKRNPEVVFEIGEVLKNGFGKIQSFSLDSWGSMLKPNANSFCPNAGVQDFYCSTGVESIVKFDEDGNNIGGKSSNSLKALSSTISAVGVSSLSATDIELSENYTCVISNGANPRTTHFFGDCMVVSHASTLSNFGWGDLKIEAVGSRVLNSFPSNDFLSLCYFCKKKLDGKDIYMYRGEKAFCSLGCRTQEMLKEEEMEKAINGPTEISREASSVEGSFQIGV